MTTESDFTIPDDIFNTLVSALCIAYMLAPPGSEGEEDLTAALKHVFEGACPASAAYSLLVAGDITQSWAEALVSEKAGDPDGSKAPNVPGVGHA